MLAFVMAVAALVSGADDAAILEHAVVSLGDTARVQAALAKARRGEDVTIGVLGGSITQGASASKEENRYGNLVAQWWRETFPKARIEFVNAGIGATGSDIGTHRVGKHLLARHPDFVVVEYAVNDPNTPAAAETLEGVLRQILKQPNHPAVLLMFMMNNAGANAQEQHAPIGAHYGLPMLSFRDALWPEIQAGRLKWEDVEADIVHPNDRGHAYAARFVTNVLQQILKQLPPDAQLPAIAPLPAAKTANAFEDGAFFSAKTLTPLRNDGWEAFDDPGFGPFFGTAWKSAQPGSTLEFELDSRAVSVLFYRVKGATGIAEASVDGGTPVKMDAWFDQTWGGYTPMQLIARDLPAGKHRLTIKLLDEKNPGSSGHEFRVYAVMTAGGR